MKMLHILFIFASLFSFVGRVALAQFKPEILQQKLFKIVPHVLNTLLLLSGVFLIFQNNWLDGDYRWIISKFLVLLAYIGFGVACMHAQGAKRWGFFAAALLSFVYIFIIAITKHGFI